MAESNRVQTVEPASTVTNHGVIGTSSSLMFQLKKWHLQSIKGRYVRTQTFRLPNGKEQEVTVFSGQNCIFYAQYTPLGTIAIHESAFGDDKVFNYVFTHETAHKKQWWSLFRIPLALLVALQAPGFLARTLSLIGETISTHDLYPLLGLPYGLSITLLLLAMPCALSWLMEFDADFQTIKTIGLQAFQDITRVTRKPFSFNSRAVIGLLTHPPAGITIRLHREVRD
jgi:hypothetical protein